MIKKIESVLPPTVIKSVVDNKRYFVCGGIWQEVHEAFSLDDAYSHWIKKTYNVKKFQQITKDKTVSVPSSDGKKTYTVVLSPNKVTCTCTGFGFRNKCKHIEKVLNNEKRKSN